MNNVKKYIWGQLDNMTYYSLLLFVISLLSSSPLKADKLGELGGLAGVSYYIGEINNFRPLYKSRPTTGVYYRHSIDKHWALRGSISYGRLAADDKDFKFDYQKERDSTFRRNFFEFNVRSEFNFLSFAPGNKKRDFIAPYVTAGLSYAFFLKTSTKPYVKTPALSFGAGCKYNYSRRFIIGAEWTLQRTFEDDIDGILKSKVNEHQVSFKNNKDWYNMVQFFIGYKLDYRVKCPAFD